MSRQLDEKIHIVHRIFFKKTEISSLLMRHLVLNIKFYTLPFKTAKFNTK